MSTPEGAIPETGQDGAAGAEAPGGDSTGQGSYAGFSTPEELASDYQAKVGDLARFQEQVRNLESLKGRHGNEIGQLRNQIATLTGQIEGMRTVQSPAQAGPTIDDIAKQLDDGDIDEAQAFRMAEKVITQQTETRLGQKFHEMLQTELGKIQQKTDHERYVEKFLSDNPGYKESYESGKLQKWLDQGMPGEQAWDKYQLEATKAELQTLKQQSKDSALQAEQRGIVTGSQIEKGKSAAGKVLTGTKGQFSQAGSSHDLSDPNQRRQAGIEYLKRLRAPG